MSLNRPTLSALIDRARADIDARLPGADSRLRRSALDVIARVHAGAAAGLYGYLDFASLQLFPDTAEAEFLVRWAAIYGVQRKPAVPAVGTIRLTGINGASVAAATILIRGDGARFRTDAGAVIADGQAIVSVTAEIAGSDGATGAGQTLVFANPAIGISAEASVQSGGVAGGAPEEDDESLRVRLLDRVRKPPQGGSANDYRRWMLEVPEVTRAWVYPGWMGAGTVGCTFVCDARDTIIPLEQDLDRVSAYIAERRPITAQPVIFAPTPIPLALVIRAVPATEAVRQAVSAEIVDLLLREAEPGARLPISHINEAISVAAGETDHELVSPTGDGYPGPGRMFVPGPIEWIN